VRDVATISLGERVSEASSDWLLAVNDAGQPRGWLAPGSTVDGKLAEDDLVAGGSLYQSGTPIRGALDAALSSPAGLGIVIDGDGKVIGAVTAQQVLAVIENRAQ